MTSPGADSGSESVIVHPHCRLSSARLNWGLLSFTGDSDVAAAMMIAAMFCSIKLIVNSMIKLTKKKG